MNDEELVSAIRQRGGEATRATLVRLLDASPLTVSRHLARLLEQGVLHRAGRGLYALPDAERQLDGEAQEIVEALRDAGVEAHLTGFDVVGPYSHQFVRSFPHLVYADLDGLREAAFALSQAGFTPVLATGPHTRAWPRGTDRQVFLRPQPAKRMDRFGVNGPVAPLEKAWLDLLRETRAGNFPASLADLGALLAAMSRGPLDERRLRSWGREMGYGDHVDAALDPDRGAESADPELRELAAGARR